MKVEKIYQNYDRSNYSHSNKRAYSNVSFAAKKPSKSLTDRITELLPGKNYIKFMKTTLKMILQLEDMMFTYLNIFQLISTKLLGMSI